jgi:hypothetical protein
MQFDGGFSADEAEARAREECKSSEKRKLDSGMIGLEALDLI